jgi:hypothetical protein
MCVVPSPPLHINGGRGRSYEARHICRRYYLVIKLRRPWFRSLSGALFSCLANHANRPTRLLVQHVHYDAVQQPAPF